jgi:hypothetical protein
MMQKAATHNIVQRERKAISIKIPKEEIATLKQKSAEE